jgi:hypothetical protein
VKLKRGAFGELEDRQPREEPTMNVTYSISKLKGQSDLG